MYRRGQDSMTLFFELIGYFINQHQNLNEFTFDGPTQSEVQPLCHLNRKGICFHGPKTPQNYFKKPNLS